MSNVSATPSDSARSADARMVAHARPVGGVRSDWAVAALSVWLLGGLFLDGWAHNHGRVDDSFFTPWHAVFYSGFVAVAAFIGWTLVRNVAQGYPWTRALPAGYEAALLGSAIFAAGGVGDMLWHTLFGIEAGVEALLSPTHLLLATGMALIFSVPLRAAWSRPETELTRASGLPVLLSLTFLLSLFTFMTQFAHPLVHPDMIGHRPSGGALVFYSQSLGVSGVLIQTALLMGMLLLALRRWHWTLPFGSLTLILGLNAFALSFLLDDYWSIPVATLAGLAADLLLHGLRPSEARPGALRLFSFAVPVIFYLAYFLALIATRGIWWSVHMWTGAVVLAGAVGWMTSLAFVPPALPAGTAE